MYFTTKMSLDDENVTEAQIMAVLEESGIDMAEVAKKSVGEN